MGASIGGDLTLYDIEKELRRCTQRANDTEEEKTELYEYCQKFAIQFVNYHKICSIEEEESFSTFVAEEMYLIALKYGPNITYWVAYMDRMVSQLLKDWLIFEYGPHNSPNNIPIVSKRYTPQMVSESVDRVYTEELILKLFKEVNDYIRRCKRFSSKVAVLNAHMSLQLSLKYKRFINFRLNEDDERICRFLYNKYRMAVIQVLRNAQLAASQYEEFEKFASFTIYDMNGVYQEEQ